VSVNGGAVTQTQSDPTTSGTPPERTRGGRGRVALGLSAIALLVSLLAFGISLLALTATGTDDSATPIPQQNGQTATVVNTPAESETIEAPPAGNNSPRATDAPLPTASANYTVAYEDRRLILQPNGAECAGNARTVDLDEPAINVSSGGDMEYQPTYRCEGAPSLQFVSDKVATVVSPDATPEDCAQAIQLSPASQEIAPSQDLVVCAVTDGQGAANEPVRAKVSRIVVTGVGHEQKITLNVTAWEIPY
jgi:hypothetical protein